MALSELRRTNISSTTELAKDSGILLFATWLLDVLRPDIVECPKALLDKEERGVVSDLFQKGLMDFPNNEVNAAILYVMAGLLQQGIPVVVHWDRMYEKLATMGNSRNG
jgi:hypothetical protein